MRISTTCCVFFDDFTYSPTSFPSQDVVEVGSYVKLRTLQLGYSLPAAVARKLLLSRARIYFSGDNLLTIKSSSLTCSDPENTAWNYPHTASFTFGVQVSF